MLTPARALRRGTTTPGFTPGQLFEPDVLLPAQFAGLSRSSAIPGEKRVILAALEDAVDVFQKYAVPVSGEGRRLFAEVSDWFASEDAARPFAFVWICNALDLDASYLRRGLAAYLARRQAGAPAPHRPWQRNRKVRPNGRATPGDAAVARARLARLRDVYRWSNAEIGAALGGLSDNSVSSLCAGQWAPSVKVAAALVTIEAQAAAEGPRVPPAQRHRAYAIAPTCPPPLRRLLAAGWSHRDIAKALGLTTHARISAWRRGVSRPSCDTATALADLAAQACDTAVRTAAAC